MGSLKTNPDQLPTREDVINPLDKFQFPVRCTYTGCGAGPFDNGIEIDEHITHHHLPQSVWLFALENIRPIAINQIASTRWEVRPINPKSISRFNCCSNGTCILTATHYLVMKASGLGTRESRNRRCGQCARRDAAKLRIPFTVEDK